MRAAFAILVILSAAAAQAAGPDEFGYFGVAPNGEQVDILFIAEPNIYGSPRVGRLSFCESEDRALTCRSTKNGPATAVYELGGAPTKESSRANRIYRTHLREKGSYAGRFLVCKIGCTGSVPRVVLELNWAD